MEHCSKPFISDYLDDLAYRDGTMASENNLGAVFQATWAAEHLTLHAELLIRKSSARHSLVATEPTDTPPYGVDALCIRWWEGTSLAGKE